MFRGRGKWHGVPHRRRHGNRRSGGSLEPAYFFRRQRTRAARGKIAQLQAGKAGAQKFFHQQFFFRQGAAQAIAAGTGKSRLIPGIGSVAHHSQLGLREFFHAALSFRRQAAVELHPVRLREPPRHPQQPAGQIAVTGQQQQPGTRKFQAADGKHAPWDVLHVGAQRGPALGIVHGGHHLRRLVQHEVALGLMRVRLQELGPHADVVAGGIGLAAQFGDHFAVHRNRARQDQFFGVAARGQTRAGDNFLQAFEHSLYCIACCRAALQ